MSAAIDKAKKLLALCTSPVEPEAKLAAYRLALLMLKHELVPSEDGAESKDATADATAAYQAGYEAGRRVERWKNEAPKQPPVWEEEEKPRRRIRSKYRGRCAECRGSYQPGEDVYWKKGGGSICGSCFEFYPFGRTA